MALTTRSYSREARASSYYSRSASYQTRRYNHFERPLSERLIERDSSWSSLNWDPDWDDPFFFDRMRWRLDDDFFKWHYGLGRTIPITYRGCERSASSRSLPVRYITAINQRPHRQYRLRLKPSPETSNFIKPDESLMKRENRISSEDWPPKQPPPTRKRTSMTIFVQQPYVDQNEVPYYRQTLPTPTYPQSARFDYY